jgi:hypothetical protein
MASFVKNVGIDHGCTDVLVAKQLLDGPDVITVLKQMRIEGMAGAQGFTEAVQKFRFCGGPRRMARVSSNLGRRELDGVNLWHRLPSSCYEQAEIIIFSSKMSSFYGC